MLLVVDEASNEPSENHPYADLPWRIISPIIISISHYFRLQETKQIERSVNNWKLAGVRAGGREPGTSAPCLRSGHTPEAGLLQRELAPGSAPTVTAAWPRHPTAYR